MIHRPRLSLELMIAAMRVHDREPAQRAVLAHALLDDERCAALRPLRFAAAAEELRRLLFGWADHPGGYVYYPYRVEARACGLVSAAQWECSRPALDMAAAVEAVTVGQLAAVGPFEHLPDLWCAHETLPIAFWWESKRQVGGELSTAQLEFRAECERSGIPYGTGDRYAVEAHLIALGVAERQGRDFSRQLEPGRPHERRAPAVRAPLPREAPGPPEAARRRRLQRTGRPGTRGLRVRHDRLPNAGY